MTRSPAIPIAVYAVLAILLVPVFPHFPSPNELTRWALAAAMVEDHSVEVTRLAPMLGPGFEDLSELHGRLYSNKAPGGALVGLPGYAIARAFAGPPSPGTMRITLNAMRLLAASLPAILLALFFVRAAKRMEVSTETTSFAVVALLFGTPLFAYGLLNFSHALTAFALFAAWYLLFLAPSSARDVGAGALIGLAVLAEYPCAVPAAVLLAFAIGSRSLPRIILGGAPFAAMLLGYNRLAFGSWFAISSGLERSAEFRTMAKSGVFGIGFPKITILVHLLFDPSKGLLVFSPILLAVPFAWQKTRAAMTKRQFASLVAVPASIILLYSGYPNWHGGWTVGARYLVAALPFLAVPLLFMRPSRLLSAALGISVAACVVTTLVFPFIPPGVPAPWGTFALPLMIRGLTAPNLLHWVARPLAVGVPLLLVAFAAGWSARERLYVALGAFAALALALALPVSPALRVQRAFIEQVVFEREGAIALEAGNEFTVEPMLIRRAEEQRQLLPPPSWPF